MKPIVELAVEVAVCVIKNNQQDCKEKINQKRAEAVNASALFF